MNLIFQFLRVQSVHMGRLDTETLSEHASGGANGEQLTPKQEPKIIKHCTPLFKVIILELANIFVSIYFSLTYKCIFLANRLQNH
jgi:hypothetical protein